jgi:hypothetical protein
MDELFDLSSLVIPGKSKKVTDYVSELEIYKHYYPEAQIANHQKNPFTPSSKTLSLSIAQYRKGYLGWKDHSTGETGSVYEFVKLWYKRFKGVNLDNFGELNQQIWKDLKVDGKTLIEQTSLFDESEGLGPASSKRKTARFQIAVTDRGWTKATMGYWVNRLGICPSILEAYHCGHAKEVWATPPGKATFLWGVSTDENPIFYFHFPATNHIKCYAPFSKTKRNKWIMNCDNLTDIQGYEQLHIKQNRPKVIIFTKAMKEIMFYRSFHLDAIAIHGESHRFHPDFIRHIKKYSEHQFSFYDNDFPGKRAAIKLQRDTGIEPFLIQGPKNITDLWEKDPQAVWRYIGLFKDKYQL